MKKTEAVTGEFMTPLEIAKLYKMGSNYDNVDQLGQMVRNPVNKRKGDGSRLYQKHLAEYDRLGLTEAFRIECWNARKIPTSIVNVIDMFANIRDVDPSQNAPQATVTPDNVETFKGIAAIVGRAVNSVIQKCKPFIITDTLSAENRRDSPLAKKLDGMGYYRSDRVLWKTNGIPSDAVKVIIASYS
jgi:hypothetical protein